MVLYVLSKYWLGPTPARSAKDQISPTGAQAMPTRVLAPSFNSWAPLASVGSLANSYAFMPTLTTAVALPRTPTTLPALEDIKGNRGVVLLCKSAASSAAPAPRPTASLPHPNASLPSNPDGSL